jgi:hypothetical protein
MIEDREFTFFNFSFEDEVAITRAPAATANCNPKMETPPVPERRNVSGRREIRKAIKRKKE